MKKYSYLSVILSAVLLTGCGAAQQSSSDKDAGNEGVIIEATTEEITVEPTTEDITDPPICTPPVSISEFECFGRKFDAADSKVNTWCNVWNDEGNIRTNYSNKNISEADLDPEYIADLVNELNSGKYEETNPFTGDHCICLDNAIDGICIVSGFVQLCGCDDLDNLTMNEEPAMYISSGDDKVSYRVPEEFKKDFDAVVEKVTVSEENIRDTYERPDYSYRDITEKEYPKDRILFIDMYSNYAWVKTLNGRFIDENGYVYKFNLSDVDFIGNYCKRNNIDDNNDYNWDDAFLECLYYDVYYKTKPVCKTDADEVFDIYMESQCILDSSEMKLKNEACDMGQYSLYVVDPDTYELIELRTRGDNVGELDDPCAREACERYDALKYEALE
ncbi:MAG TPA: hypothetical protein P5191_10300 [Ruminococcus sp.]|nr:hypothetical protein [Ruminococcus sp.]